MNLFVVNQVAGAEYVFPLLDKWAREGRRDWTVYAAPASAEFLNRNGISYRLCGMDGSVGDLGTVKTIVDDVAPTAAILSTSANSPMEHDFVIVLRERRVPCAQFIDNWVNYTARFQRAIGSGAPSFPDHILTLDETARREMLAEGIPGDRIEVVGQPYLERQMLQYRARPRRPASTLVLAVSQPISRFYGKALGYDEWDFVLACLEALNEAGRDAGDPHVLVHPAEDVRRYAEWAASHAPRIRLVRSADIDLQDYGLVVGMFSLVLVHALVAGVPAVSFQPGAVGSDPCFLSRVGYIARLTSGASLRPALAWPGTSVGSGPSVVELERMLEGSTERLERFIFETLNRRER